MKRSIMLHESRICADGWLLWFVVVLGTLVLVLALTTTAAAATANYSLEGWFANGSETQSVLFSLNEPISMLNFDPFSIRTWQYGGGTNAAGDVITPGGFDPVLSLYDGSNILVAANDDIDTGNGLWDSQITWGALTELPAGDYRFDLTAYGSTLGGRERHWAVDLIGPAPPVSYNLTLTALNRSGVSTVKSLKFGAVSDLLTQVKIETTEAMVISGDLILGPNSEMIIEGGTLAAGRIEVHPDGILRVYDGTVSTNTLVHHGVLSGAGAIILADEGSFLNFGVVGPGSGLDINSPIVLPNGDFFQDSGGSLFMTIGGTGLADYDRLQLLEGSAALAGSLYLSLAADFVPAAGNSFELVTAAAGLDASGLNYHLPDLSSYGLEWHVSTTPTSLVLTVENSAGRGASRASDAVPEPGTLWLAALGGMLLAGWVCRRSSRVMSSGELVVGVLVLSLLVTSPATADEVYFSFEGWFADGTETQSFFFQVPSYSQIAPPDPFALRTWQNSGGVNAAGDAIPPLGFDSRLWLYDSSQSLVATSDDGTGLGLDSLITWVMPNLPPYSIPPPNPLPAGDYRLDVTAFNSTLLGRQPHWAVDLVLPTGPLWLTGVGHSGTSTIKSLKFGTASSDHVALAQIGGGQSLVMSGELVVGENAVMTNAGLISAGRIRVEDIGWLTLDDGTVSTSELVINGRLFGTGDVILNPGGALQNHGTLLPGHWWYTPEESITGEGGPITVARGDYKQTNRLEIYIGGRSPAQYGQLHVLDGSATLGGELLADLVDLGGSTFEPAAGDRFEILTAAGGLGGTEFVIESLPPLAGGLYFDVLYGPNDVTLAVLGVLGDYNCNGIVDAADFTVWRDTLGASGRGLAADGSGPLGTPDEVVDQLDYELWKAHFGETAPGSGALAGHLGATGPDSANPAVPEPTSLVLLACGAASAAFVWTAAKRTALPATSWRTLP